MSFIADTCPTCGGDIQLDYTKKKGYCLICGSQVLPDNKAESIETPPSQSITKKLYLAEQAYANEDFVESIKYCNFILEEDSENYLALLIKGQSIGWPTSFSNINFVEATNCLSNAILYSPKNQQIHISDLSIVEIRKLVNAKFDLRCKHFEENLDEEEALGISFYMDELVYILSLFESETKIYFADFNVYFTQKIIACISKLFENVILPEYQANNGQPDKNEVGLFVERVDLCTSTLEDTMFFIDDKETNLTKYELLIDLYKATIDAKYWEYQYIEKLYGENEKRQFKKLYLSNKAIENREFFIFCFQNAIDEIKQKG